MASERQAWTTSSPWWGEHVHRYLEVTEAIGPDARILDLACGTGFGTEVLAGHTRGLVVGGDLAFEAIQRNGGSGFQGNVAFAAMDGTRLPFPNGSFDLVVSFETIEHTTRYREMLAEFRRILRSGGRAFISTPNFLISSPTGVILNPFHTQEFTFDELTEILEEAFSRVTIYGQRYARYDGHRGGRKALGQILERVLYLRGFRKFPLGVQDALLRSLTGTPMYPTTADFSMVSDHPELLACKTFFAVCETSAAPPG